MKQYITKDQLNELSDKGKEELRKWWKPEEGDFYYSHRGEEKFYGQLDSSTEAESAVPDKVYFAGTQGEGKEEDLPLLSIGQMIELLGDQEKEYGYPATIEDDEKYIQSPYINGWKIETMCDELWEEVKEVLND